MGVADTPTLLPLARWARILGIDPLHFEGVFVNDLNTAAVCGVPIFQHAWQADGRMSREEIAEHIGTAERMVAEAAGYWPAPTWIQDERHSSFRPARPELFRSNFLGPRGQAISVRQVFKYHRVGGQRAVTLIEAGASIVFSDSDGDTYEETATVTATTDITDVCEIRAFYPGHAGEDLWEIRPVTVTVSGGTATIVFRRELVVVEEQLERIGLGALGSQVDISAGINGLTGNLFESTVDIYRVFNDVEEQARLEWEPTPDRLCSCGTDCAACRIGFQTACIIPRGDLRLGNVAIRPATFDATATGSFTTASLAVCRDPDWVRIWYYAGWRWEAAPVCTVTQMDPFFERIVARLAASMMGRDLCGCVNVNLLINHWRQDLALSNDAGGRQLSLRALDNPWGTTRGAAWAWGQLRQRTVRTGEAVLT